MVGKYYYFKCALHSSITAIAQCLTYINKNSFEKYKQIFRNVEKLAKKCVNLKGSIKYINKFADIFTNKEDSVGCLPCCRERRGATQNSVRPSSGVHLCRGELQAKALAHVHNKGRHRIQGNFYHKIESNTETFHCIVLWWCIAIMKL